MKKLLRFKKYLTAALVVMVIYIFFLYLKWGVVEAFKHYPSWDEGGILSLVSNFARYGKYESQFGSYNYPKHFDPFMSIGPPFIMLLSALIKIFGYHFYVVGLIIFFLVSIPLIFSLIFLLNSLIIRKLTGLNKLILSVFFFIFLITNRLFYFSPPTGGSFTHGPLGEPFSLLSIALSSTFLLYGIKKNKLNFLYIAGIFSSLAYETKNISILFFISQTFIFILILLLTKIKNSNIKIKQFYLKSFLFFVLGFITLSGMVWIWRRSNFTAKEYVRYSCWKKVSFITMGSGSNNVFKLNANRLEGSFNNASNVLINFFSDNIGDPWGTHNKFVITAFFVLLYFFVIKRLLNKSKFLFIIVKKLNYETASNIIIELGLTITFLLGSLWFFFISDYQWIRHFYAFIFIGFLIFYSILIESFDKKIFNIFLLGLLAFFVIFYLPKSPLVGSYHFREILINTTEENDQKFLSFYKPLSSKKTFVCGIYKAEPVSFLSGINFYNNILEDSNDVYPKCNTQPGLRVRSDLKPPFIYINLASEKYYPECMSFFEKNKERFKKIYDYGNGIYEYK